MSKSHRTKQDTEKHVKNVISELQNGHGSSLYGALITLRTTLIKSKSALSQLIKLGVIRLLVETLEDTSRHAGQNKILDIVMSILANLCMEDIIRKQVIDKNIIATLARVTLTSDQDSIHNRGIRALANLAQEPSHCDLIVGLEVPEFVAKCLMETEDEECRSTYIRALRLFSKTEKGVKRLVEDTQAVQSLAALLKLDNKKLAFKSLRVLSEISAVRCCASFSGQILAANVLEELVKLADDDDNDIGYFSFSLILRFCEQEQMRPALGAAGVIALFLKHLNGERVFVNKVSALNALCLCTKESVNRVKISDSGGLELLLSALQGGADGQYAMLYDRIISSLVNFMYSDECLAKLLKHGLVSVLIDHLKRCCRLTSREEHLRKEVYILADAAEVERKGFGNDDSGNMESTSRHQGEVADLSGSVDVSLLSHEEDGKLKMQHLTDSSDFDMQCDEAGEECSQVEKFSANEDPLLIDSSLATDSEGVLLGELAPDEQVMENEELQPSPVCPARHTFSINSPTYQVENSWRMEDYNSGVTCKTFTSDPDVARATPASPNLAPYSPLSTATQYYSPSNSSPSFSNSLSPHCSPLRGSPMFGSPPGHLSPTQSLSSTDQQSVSYSSQNQSSSSSPPWQANYNPFSPLLFPASPLQSDSEPGAASPASHSQKSSASHACSQDQLLPSMDRSQNSTTGSQQTDAELSSSQDVLSQTPQFFCSVLRHATKVHDGLVYSASEDEDDDEVSSVGQDLVGPDALENCCSASSDVTDMCNEMKSSQKIESPPQISHLAEIGESNTANSDLMSTVIQEGIGSNKCNEHDFSKTSLLSSASVVTQSNSVLLVIQETTYKVTKNQREDKTEQFRIPNASKENVKKSDSTPSSSPQVQSPYRSPYTETSFSPKHKSVFDSVRMVKAKLSRSVKTSVVTKEGTDTNTGANSAADSEHAANMDRRRKKILKMSEFNILILLSRVSLKQNPTEFISEVAVITSLLDYIRLADKPMKRCCRILHRLCGNPLSFERLLLLEIPALVVKILVLDDDGTFPSIMFCAEWRNQFGGVQRSRMNISNFSLPSSQSSDDAGSQKSELGRMMDLEFGGDAYSRMVSSSTRHSRLENFYVDQPSWSSGGHTTKDECSGDDIYEPGCSRVDVRVQFGFRLLHSLGSVAMSSFGRGEIDHVLTSPSAQQRLACLVSLLYLPVGSKHSPTRKIFLRRYKLWDQLLPYLFLPMAAPAREAIISGISLNLHLESPPKSVAKISRLDICPDLGNNPSTTESGLCSDQDVSNVRGSPTGKRATKKHIGAIHADVCQEKQAIAAGDVCIYSELSAGYDLYFVTDCSDQKETYGVSKEKLMSKSSVFAAMLGGSYAESRKSQILITEVNSFGFKFVLHYLHGCSRGCSLIDSLEPTSHASSDSPTEGSEVKALADPALTSGIKLTTTDLASSQDSLGCLSLEDETGEIKTGDSTGRDLKSPPPNPSLIQLIDRCADILEIADKYLLSDLIQYVSSVLSHTCLQPDTCMTIFPLACFYKLDSLSVDCIRETLLSNISCRNAANVYVDLAACGYKEQVKNALLTLLNNTFKD